MAGTDDLVFVADDVKTGTHALVIGIGAYSHLGEGRGADESPEAMRPLTSPPLSARAFTTWLIDQYRAVGKDLASVSLLLGETNPSAFQNPRTGASQMVPDASIENIVEAVKKWKGRGNTDPGNRLIFYFCGHGVSAGNDMALIASDFSLDDDNPLNHALDFRRLRNGLKKCQASEQVFIIDACRTSSEILIGQSDGLFVGQVPLLEGQRTLGLPMLKAMTYFATLSGYSAYARENDVSLFTQALLRGLRGAGSDNIDDDWRVTTSQLAAAIADFMERRVLAGNAVHAQAPTVTDLAVFDLHYLPGEPVVPVYVSCDPPEDNSGVEFVCSRDGQVQSRRTLLDVNADDPAAEWYLELVRGDYQFDVVDAGRGIRSIKKGLRPAFTPVKFKRV